MGDDFAENLDADMMLKVSIPNSTNTASTMADEHVSMTRRVKFLEAELQAAKTALTHMLLDVIAMETLAQERLDKITALEARINAQARPDHDSYEVDSFGRLQKMLDLIERCEKAEKERDDLARENVELTEQIGALQQHLRILSLRSSAADAVTMVQQPQPKQLKGRDDDRVHPRHTNKEVDELRRLVQFYKQNSERTSKEVRELQMLCCQQEHPHDDVMQTALDPAENDGEAEDGGLGSIPL